MPSWLASNGGGGRKPPKPNRKGIVVVRIAKPRTDWDNGLISDKEMLQAISLAVFDVTHKLSMDACEKRRANSVHAIVSIERSIVTALRKLEHFSSDQ